MLLVDDFESAPVMGWISPKGEVHELGGYNNHDRWAYAKHGVSADFLMSKGWVRKAHRDSYEAGSDSALPRVLKHVRRHHPDVGEFYFDTPSQKTLGGVRTWLVPVSRPGAKQLLGEGHNEVPAYGWISPTGETHDLGGYNDHDRWAERVQGMTSDQLLSKGWIRKGSPHAYQAGSDSALPRVLKHIRLHHPMAQNFYFDTPSEKHPGGLRSWHVPVRMPGSKRLLGDVPKGVWLTRDSSVVKEVVEAIVRGRYAGGRGVDPVAQWNAYFNNRPAGWITPTGDFHSLSDLPEGRRTHPRWIEANQDIVKQYGHLVVKGPHAAENTHDAMMRGGWVQKENKDRYRVWGPEALKTVQDHVKKHHPETREVTVEIVNTAKGGTSFKSPVYESEDAMRASLASWLIHIALGGGAGGHRSLDRYGLQEP